MAAIKFLLIFCIGTSLLYYLFSFYCVAKFFKQKENKPADYLPPVSILKAVKGIEAQSDQNFESFCYLDYPVYQVNFGMIEKNDPVIPVIESLRERHPQADIHLHSIGYGDAPNEKVWILQNLLEKSKYDILVINDADIKVGPDYLKAIVAPLRDPKVGLVTIPYRAIVGHGKRFYSLLTALYINTDFFPAVMVANQLRRVDFGLGATMAIRRQVLMEIGGFEALANLLADDFHLGNRIYKAGYNVVLIPYLVDTVLHHQDFQGFFHQQLRWARTLRACRPWGYFWSIITQGITASCLYILVSRFSREGFILFALTLITRLTTSLVVGVKYLKLNQRDYSFWLLPIRDLLGTLFWLLSFLGNTITWRDKRFILDREGRIHRL